VRYLADVLSAIHRLATGAEEADDHENVSIRLLSVKRGSAVFQCVAAKPDDIISRLRRAGKWLQNPDQADKLAYALQPLQELSKIASALDCPIIVREPGRDRDVIAKILPETYKSLADSVLVKGDKTIQGNVQRVGGATDRRCALRVTFQSRLLYCTVNSLDLVRTLGRCLYQDVVVSGTATWLKRNWRIVHFKVREVHQPKLGAVTEAFEALRDAGGSAWDQIEDPESYLDELSGKR
jgi:hypothetical protein